MKKHRFHLYVDAAVFERLRKASYERRTPMSVLAEKALKMYLADRRGHESLRSLMPNNAGGADGNP